MRRQQTERLNKNLNTCLHAHHWSLVEYQREVKQSSNRMLSEVQFVDDTIHRKEVFAGQLFKWCQLSSRGIKNRNYPGLLRANPRPVIYTSSYYKSLWPPETYGHLHLVKHCVCVCVCVPQEAGGAR